MKRLVLIDAHAIIHRCYHALPPLTTPAGEAIGAVYGFTTILLRILRELKPDYIAAAFDLPGPTFRHVAYERYKAQRPETPSDLAGQFIKVREVLDAFDIPHFEREGYEADDIIGTIAKKLEKKKDVEMVVVTGDMDTLQLVRPRLKVYSMRKGISDIIIYDEKAVRERYGLKPAQLIDFKGLRGDPSDNIPGVKGIGEKTATELIKNFGSMEGVYKALRRGDKKISESVATRLREGEKDAKFSRELAAIKTDVPVDFSLEALRRREDQGQDRRRALFQRLGFSSLIKRLGENEAVGPAQGTLPVAVRVKENATSSCENLTRFIKKFNNSEIGVILEGEELFLIPRAGEAVFRLDKKVLSSPEAKKFFEEKKLFAHDGKSLLHFLRPLGIKPRFIFDLMIAAYLTEPFSRDFSYLAIANRELGRLISPSAKDELPHFFEIVARLQAKLAEGKLRRVFEEIEMPLVEILAETEGRGILIDGKFLRELGKKIDARLSILAEKIHGLAGGHFNINSPQELRRVLFENLKIKIHGLRKTEKGGVVSTRESELEKLRGEHPIIESILEHRELMKLKTTYIDVLPSLISKKTGRLHTTFNQTGTSTGRLSSSDPNLQNIPIMSEYGREIRRAFIAESGFTLVSFDYSQIELRVAAHIANDKKMIEAFQKGLDIHRLTASEIYNVSIDRVTPDLRRAAKTLNFGILYGMGPHAFAESTGLSREDAKKFIDEYFRDFSGVRDYVERTKQFVEENGYVETIFGRRRYIPEIHSPNWRLKREAERMAINMPVQGSATGDIIKLAMIKVDEWIKKENLANDIRLLLQVHDELLFEIKKGAVKEGASKIREIMESVVGLKVPLAVDVKMGPDWSDQRPIL